MVSRGEQGCENSLETQDSSHEQEECATRYRLNASLTHLDQSASAAAHTITCLLPQQQAITLSRRGSSLKAWITSNPSTPSAPGWRGSTGMLSCLLVQLLCETALILSTVACTSRDCLLLGRRARSRSGGFKQVRLVWICFASRVHALC